MVRRQGRIRYFIIVTSEGSQRCRSCSVLCALVSFAITSSKGRGEARRQTRSWIVFPIGCFGHSSGGINRAGGRRKIMGGWAGAIEF